MSKNPIKSDLTRKIIWNNSLERSLYIQMETNSNLNIDDNARLKQENWEFRKAGSNKDHLSLILQIEKKDKKLEKYARIIDQLKIENKNSIKESKRE
ncbi:hypothetical protein CYY_002985 [Polysphondylium violaceum]|uniref:Uncharacterized protein n=1 Tax=Polysphondylium violaceum TaxID=133409 RepID=A0A8J4PZA3_9MYCE|nr:hypothetical protein CYY_002985 [Polysphondylium violaceum]